MIIINRDNKDKSIWFTFIQKCSLVRFLRCARLWLQTEQGLLFLQSPTEINSTADPLVARVVMKASRLHQWGRHCRGLCFIKVRFGPGDHCHTKQGAPSKSPRNNENCSLECFSSCVTIKNTANMLSGKKKKKSLTHPHKTHPVYVAAVRCMLASFGSTDCLRGR